MAPKYLAIKHLQDRKTEQRLKMIKLFYEENPKSTQKQVIAFIPETKYMVELYNKGVKLL